MMRASLSRLLALVCALALCAQALGQRTTYFGNCTSAGATPVGWGSTFDFFGSVTFYGSNGGTQDFICPGTGPQTVNSMGVYAQTRGSPHSNVRMAIYGYADESADGGTIYDPTLTLICQWDAAVLVNSTAQWWDHTTFTGTPTLTGGNHYKIAMTGASSLLSYAYTSGSNATQYITTDYTSGLPSPIAAGTGWGENMLTRVSITGDGTTPPAATQETYYVDTDSVGASPDGSTTNPYHTAQAAINARWNKTFTLPIVINAIGATADLRLTTSGLVSMSTDTVNEARFFGNFSGAKKDLTKYHIETAFVHGLGEGTAINPTANNMWVDGVQLGQSTVSGQDAAAEIGYVSGTNFRMSNSLIYGCNDSNVGNTTRGISSVNGVSLWNVIITDLGAGIGTGIQNHQNSKFYSCTISGPAAGTGINVADGTSIAKNCYLQGGSASITISSGSLTQTTCATSDTASSTPALRNVPLSTANFVSVTHGSFDFNLAPGSALKGTGTDTSGDAPPFNFTTDISGFVRTAPWDIGAAKYIAPGSTGRPDLGRPGVSPGTQLGVDGLAQWNRCHGWRASVVTMRSSILVSDLISCPSPR